jgi:hypothetical protein
MLGGNRIFSSTKEVTSVAGLVYCTDSRIRLRLPLCIISSCRFLIIGIH